MPTDGAASGRAVLAWKGLEPCVFDFAALLAHLRRPSYSAHDMAEHLAIEEGKVPGCATLAECVREAERAAAVQSAHVVAYGTLARLPVPLFVYRHGEETAARVRDLLRGHLSAAVFESVRPRVEAGLGAYVYAYPSPPMRVRDLDFALHGAPFAERAAALSSLCDPEAAIGRWVATLARMLNLGFLPATLASIHTGVCCQPQNACLDGGFVDLDSVAPISDVKDDTALSAALQLTFESVLKTVRTLLVGASDPRKELTENRVDLHELRQHLLARLSRALGTETRPSLALDPRVARYVTPAADAGELLQRLAAYHGSEPAGPFEAASASFRALAPAVFAAVKAGS
jgi:hypothetical protein